MIFERATINLKKDRKPEFERGVAEALLIFRRAKGFKSLRLERSIEHPLRYFLIVAWETVDDHIMHFRNSDDFQAWRSLVGHTFAEPPSVEHTEAVLIET